VTVRTCYASRVLRLLLIGGMAFHLALASVAAGPEADACTQQCSADDSRGACPPNCQSCVCCHHLTVFEATVEPKLLSALERASFAPRRPLTPRAPAPGKLLRPPIALA
jgi:hypothetical protein